VDGHRETFWSIVECHRYVQPYVPGSAPEGGKQPLFAVESPARRQRRVERHLGEVLVQEHAGDELLPRGDAELLVEALDVVIDGVRGQDERLGQLCSRQAAGQERGDLPLASGRAERLEPDGR
jgi:hypothetical protein